MGYVCSARRLNHLEVMPFENVDGKEFDFKEEQGLGLYMSYRNDHELVIIVYKCQD
jgi:hypothetical protein